MDRKHTTNTNPYWLRRVSGSPLSRRRFVAGMGATGMGLAALSLAGCGGDDDGAPATGTPSGGSGSAAASQTAVASGTTASNPKKGGVFRTTSANNTWDTFDVDRSRFTPVHAIFGLTSDAIINWKSYANAELEGAFASAWQQPDPLTLILTLRDNLRWHDKRPVNGRAATANDMAAFIMRNKEAKLRDGTEDRANFFRLSRWQRVERAEVTDAKTVKVTFSAPDPLFIGTLAGGAAKVMAPEAIDAFEADFNKPNEAQVIGTGGFVLTRFEPEGEIEFRRFEKAWRQTWWDGVHWFPLFTDQAAQQAGFEQRQLDDFAPVNVNVREDLKRRYAGKIHEVSYFASNPQAGTYAAHSEPWSDPRKIGAIFRAFDRRAVLNSPVQGQGALSGNLCPAVQPFAIPEKELITIAGYLEDRALDEREARAMWEASGGPALGDITVDIPDIWEGLYPGGTALIVTHLKDVLGNDFTPRIEPYTTISTKITGAKYGNGNNNIWYGWVAAIEDPDPTLQSYQVYNSSQPQWRQFGFKSDRIDSLTLEAVNEFDIGRRRELSKELDREVLRNYGAGLSYTLCQIVPVLFWNYVHHDELSPFSTVHQRANGWWFNQDDPTWQGRKG